jgi:hypothetical protein
MMHSPIDYKFFLLFYLFSACCKFVFVHIKKAYCVITDSLLKSSLPPPLKTTAVTTPPGHYRNAPNNPRPKDAFFR